ncbi:LacI family DNA-binding transcriptional regulator [Nonlabens xiamenensis]|uniref:LacI family DNA-binding transcriptional regulator n=1 Tax=Nonlabens xiamenensis TaxID=2341043 RepID=UPI000F60B277|nr:LacI family DNA-binding transcriptional regulator [Nonlabens xiamenensis]
MKKNKVTLKQLAEELELSVSTISKALNKSNEISEETTQRVAETAQKMGYKSPSTSGIQQTISVLIPDIKNDFFAMVLNGLGNEARSQGFKLVTAITHESLEEEIDYIRALDTDAIDGFIIAVARETQESESYDHFEKLIASGKPVVMFDRVVDHLECDKIVNDDYLSGSRVVESLLESGDRHICMASTISSLSVGRLREEGIRKQLSKHQDVIFNYITEVEEERFLQRMEDALKYDGIQSVIALDQLAGVHTLNKAQELGIKVPEELQIICYSNGALARYAFPKMTVVDQHAEELGKKAFIRMHNLIKNKDEVKVTRVHTLKSTLVKRGTTRQ